MATDHRGRVVVASFAASTGGGFTHTAGRSSIRNPDAAVIAQAGPEIGAIARVTMH